MAGLGLSRRFDDPWHHSEMPRRAHCSGYTQADVGLVMIGDREAIAPTMSVDWRIACSYQISIFLEIPLFDLDAEI
jgi:hypothetical protein